MIESLLGDIRIWHADAAEEYWVHRGGGDYSGAGNRCEFGDFSALVNGILLRPLPYSQPERLVRMWEMGMPKGALLGAAIPRAGSGHRGLYAGYAGFNFTGFSEPLRLKGAASLQIYFRCWA